jgi:O-antigen/teichoic acid export membrane protein
VQEGSTTPAQPQPAKPGQHVAFGISIVIVVLSGLLLLPFMSRGYSDTALVKVSILLLMNSFFGTFEVLRPVFVLHFASRPQDLNWRALAVPPLLVSAIMCPLALILALTAYSDVFSSIEAMIIAGTLAIFLVYSALWSVLDIVGLVGTGYLVRSSGTMLLYVLFALGALTSNDHYVVYMFAACHLTIMIVYTLMAKRYVTARSGAIVKDLYRSAVSVFSQNIAKMFIDFSDRLLISQSMTASYVVSYILSFELVSKSNLPAQLLSNYCYPSLCRREMAISRFVDIGVVMALCLTAVGAVVSLYGEPALKFYFGRDDATLHPIFSILVSVFALYTLAFFSQAALRSVNELRLLAMTFVGPAVLGGLLMIPLYFQGGFTGLLVCVFVMRCPGIIGILAYKGFSTRHKLLSVLVLSGNLIVFIYNLRNLM